MVTDAGLLHFCRVFRGGAGLTREQIQIRLREHIAPYKCPSRIVIRDALPLGPTGKIWKGKLADMATRI